MNPEAGQARRNAGYAHPRSGFEYPKAGCAGRESGYVRPKAGYGHPKTGRIGPKGGFTLKNAVFAGVLAEIEDFALRLPIFWSHADTLAI